MNTSTAPEREQQTTSEAGPQPRLKFRLLQRAGLRGQLLLATIGPLLLLLLALAGVGLYAFTRVTQRLVEERDAELVQLSAGQVADHWAETLLLLSQVASTDELRSGDPVEMQTLLAANDALLRRFDALHMTDASGRLVAGTVAPPLETLADQPVFIRARDFRRPARSVALASAQEQPMVLVAVPVYDAQRRFGGCLIGAWTIGSEAMGMPLSKVRAGPGAFAYLVDGDGRVLWHPDPRQVGVVIAQHPAVAKAMVGQTGAETIDDAGHTVVIGYGPIPADVLTSSLFADPSWQGWSLLIAEPWEYITAPYQPYLMMIVLLLSLMVTVPLLVLAISSQRVIAPLLMLVEQVDRVASGEFTTQVSINRGPSEVRNLEVKFNDMVRRLRRYQADTQNYVSSVLSSQEQERKRIARELHDETAQALIVLGRRIEDAQSQADDPALAASLAELRDMVDDTVQGVRRFTSDLRPPLLEELGLPHTLEILGRRTAREDNLDVAVTIEGEPQPLLPEVELALYRLAQEGLSNVRRHAGAAHVTMSLHYAADTVTLSLSDDGAGFEVPEDISSLVATGRLGLMGIHERARLLGGAARITSLPGQGAKIRVTIPIKQTNART